MRFAASAIARHRAISLWTQAPSSAGVPLLEGRGLVGGLPAAYVCRGFTCRMPVTTPSALKTELLS